MGLLPRHRPTLAAITTLVLVLATGWLALAVWQWNEYARERQAAEDTLRRQAESIKNALVGGIRSHPRLGPFFEDLFQGVLDELAASKDVLAVAIASHPTPPSARQILLWAGDKGLVQDALPLTPNPSPAMGEGSIREASKAILDGASRASTKAFRFQDTFRLEADSPGGPRGPGGGGWGRGRGSRRWEEAGEEGPFSKSGLFDVVLALDRSAADAQIHRAFWLRTWVVSAGGIAMVSMALAWLGTLWFLEARSRARVLEIESRHLRDLSQAAAGLAHETRNPLGLVRGWTQRLADADLSSSEQRRQAQAIVEECDRITARINQFLAFARPCQPTPEAVDARSLLAELGMILEPDLEAKCIRLRADAPPGLAVQADREMLRQALFNLLGNAIQFSPDQGTVEVSFTAAHDGSCRIEVADRGPGVPADKVPLLFTPYFTLRPNGTGLGLAIVRRIAAAHGWQTGYTPRPGGGAIFWIDRIHA